MILLLFLTSFVIGVKNRENDLLKQYQASKFMKKTVEPLARKQLKSFPKKRLGVDPDYNPDEYFNVMENTACDTTDIMGAQGSTDMADCEYNCWVNPQCTFAMRVIDGYQCWWGANCKPSTSKTTHVGFRKKQNTAADYYYFSNGFGGRSSNLLATKSLSIKDALEYCTTNPSCNNFFFNSPGHLPNGTVQVYFMNGDQIIDSDTLSSKWQYYKNSTLLPYCDASVTPQFAPAKRGGVVTLNYKYCQGKGIIVQLLDPRGVVQYNSSQSFEDSGSVQIPTPLSSVEGDVWTVRLSAPVSFGSAQVKVDFPIKIVGNVCDAKADEKYSTTWPTTILNDTASLDCWNVSKGFAAGQANRRCSSSGWEKADFSKCTNSGFTIPELEYLQFPAAQDMWYPDQFISMRITPWARFQLYFPGNKIYGWETKLQVDSECKVNGGEDIPGNMVGPEFRRQQIGWSMGVPDKDSVCTKYNRTFHVSIEQNDKYYINNWFNITWNNGAFKIQTDNERLMVRGANLAYHEFHVMRFVISDKLEEACAASLAKVCKFHTGNTCLMCAAKNALSLQHCYQDSNAMQVIKFWCTCKDIRDCGGELTQ